MPLLEKDKKWTMSRPNITTGWRGHSQVGQLQRLFVVTFCQNHLLNRKSFLRRATYSQQMVRTGSTQHVDRKKGNHTTFQRVLHSKMKDNPIRSQREKLLN